MSPFGTNRSDGAGLLMSVVRGRPKRPAEGQTDAIDAVDGAHSAASKCHRVVALKQTT